jgi:two-component sensor histidine kinase
VILFAVTIIVLLFFQPQQILNESPNPPMHELKDLSMPDINDSISNKNITYTEQADYRPERPPMAKPELERPPRGRRPGGPPGYNRPPFEREKRQGRVPPFANILIMSLLIIGFDTGIALYSHWTRSEQNRLKTEKENVKTQMVFLKNQVSPHFFMNTLNNIHALVDIDSEEAKESIMRLSDLMDYMLYRSESSFVSLVQELEFIDSYVELMRLRYTDDVEINLDFPDVVPQVLVPPLLTISFIENAFKYGVDAEKDSFININFEIEENRMIFKAENSIHNSEIEKRQQGIGIDNARKRLNLIFNDSYQLRINDENNIFSVTLNIPV